MQDSSSRPYGRVTVAHLNPQHRTYARDCHVPMCESDPCSRRLRRRCSSLASPSPVPRPALLVLQGRSAPLVPPLLYPLYLSCRAARPSSPSWPETLAAAAATALLRRAPTAARPSSSAHMQAATALLRRAPVAARPPDQRMQAAAALRRGGPVYFFHASGANPIEKYLLDSMVVAGILHKPLLAS